MIRSKPAQPDDLNFVWAKDMGGAANANGYSIAVDASGNVYTTGIFQGAADFDPGPDMYNLTSAGGYDIFVSKYNSSGAWQWARNYGGQFDDDGRGIAVNHFYQPLITGGYQNRLMIPQTN